MRKDDCERPWYPYPPIGSVSALSRMLGHDPARLLALASAADSSYRAVQILKPNGKVRECWDASPELKSAQARIVQMIFRHVVYPSYLMGGLPGRDHVRNAAQHADARVLVGLDIKSFFPSTTAGLVLDMFLHLFHFPPEVARLLTQLTTRAGQLPQGAKTSSYISNLVFYKAEPRLESRLRARGFRYTRFIDDITVSSKRDLENEDVQRVIQLVLGMLRRHGYHVARKKLVVERAGQRRTVTKLVVGEGHVGLPVQKRSAIRAAVHQIETAGLSEENGASKTRRASAQIGQLKRLHPRSADALRRRLKALRSAEPRCEAGQPEAGDSGPKARRASAGQGI